MNTRTKKMLTRAEHGPVSGTLAGFADYYNLNLPGLRLVFIILAFCGGIGVIFYLVLLISIPAYSQRAALLRELEGKEGE